MVDQRRMSVVLLQVMAAAVAIASLGSILSASDDRIGAAAPDRQLLITIETQIPSKLKPLYERTYPDKAALLKSIREWQRLSVRLAMDFSSSEGSGEIEGELPDATWAAIFVERFCVSDAALRFTVENTIGLSSLQEWAVRFIRDTQPDDGDRSRLLRWSDVDAPSPLKALGGFLIPVRSAEGSVRAYASAWAAGSTTTDSRSAPRASSRHLTRVGNTTGGPTVSGGSKRSEEPLRRMPALPHHRRHAIC